MTTDELQLKLGVGASRQDDLGFLALIIS